MPQRQQQARCMCCAAKLQELHRSARGLYGSCMSAAAAVCGSRQAGITNMLGRDKAKVSAGLCTNDLNLKFQVGGLYERTSTVEHTK